MNQDIEDYLHTEMRAATRNIEVDPQLVFTALSHGRRRRRARLGLAAAGSVAAVTAIGVALPGLLGLGSQTLTPHARGGGEALQWASRLPQGEHAKLPHFASGELHDGRTTVAVPDDVNTSVPARRVDGGWVVVTGEIYPDLTPAVLAPDGTLSPLPTYRPGSEDARQTVTGTVLASPDGDFVAYGDQVLEIATGEVTEIPHDPADAPDTDPEYANTLGLTGWSEEGLVYTGAPQREGFGTEWLWEPGREPVRLSGPDEGAPRSMGGSATGWSLGIRYTDQETDTCTTMHRLEAGSWSQVGDEQCMGQYLGEALDVSPDGRWLLTDDLPRVWNLRDGEWAAIEELPGDLIRDSGEYWMGDIGWEDREHVLFNATEWPDTFGADGPVRLRSIVVRCSVTSGECERAGEEHTLTLDPMSMGPGGGFSPY